MSGGFIPRKDIIENEALEWGDIYKTNVEKAIKINRDFIETLKELYEANKKVRSSTNNKEYQESLRKTNEIQEKATGIWKEQIALENALISTKRKNQLS